MEDKGKFSSSLFALDGNELYRVIATYNFMCGHAHTYAPVDTRVTHAHSRQCKLGRLAMLPSACGERDMAGGRPQTAKVIVMGSTQSLSPRQQ